MHSQALSGLVVWETTHSKLKIFFFILTRNFDVQELTSLCLVRELSQHMLVLPHYPRDNNSMIVAVDNSGNFLSAVARIKNNIITYLFTWYLLLLVTVIEITRQLLHIYMPGIICFVHILQGQTTQTTLSMLRQKVSFKHCEELTTLLHC